MKANKKMAALAISLSLSLVSLCSCVPKATDGDDNKSASQISNSSIDQSDSNVTNERIKVKIFRPKEAHESSMDQMDVFKILGDKFNMDFDFDNPPEANSTERLNLVMMEAELPDIIINLPMTDLLKYGESGAIIPLEDIIETKMPNLKSELDKRPSVIKKLKQQDGHIYHLPMLDEKTSGNIPYLVRLDWLNKLGLERPVTISDWENFWEKVKNTDLNGNGENDEIPFSAYEIERLRNFCVAWGVVDDFYTDPNDNGNIHYGPIEDKYKEALIWMKKMWDKGYIDPEIITTDYASFSSKMSQNNIASLAGPLGGMLASQNKTMSKIVEDFRLGATEPPKGEAGVQIHSNIDLMPRSQVGAVISKSCKHIERVIELLDYLYSKDGQILLNLGSEGKQFKYENDKAVFTDTILNNPDGLSPKQAIGTFTISQGIMPSVLLSAQTSQIDDEAALEAKEKYIIPFLDESNKYIITGSTSFNTEDDAVRRATMADIDTYVDEMVMKFITGREDISNWENYVNHIKDMGIDKVIEIYQKSLIK